MRFSILAKQAACSLCQCDALVKRVVGRTPWVRLI